jgi:type IV pilus assembly protein PilW
MVELMIEMVIGIFLSGGLLIIFDKTKQAHRYQNALSQTQEQGRFAIGFLTQSLRIAGFPGDNPPAGNKIEGTDGATDTVTIRLRDNLDCRDVATGGVAVNQFRINANNLECSGDGINWDVFVQNVENMQIMYGEDLDADGVANRYVTATTGPNWANVVSARVSLLVRSSDNSTTINEDYQNLAGNTIAGPDKRLRRSFVTTVGLRN